MIPRTGNAIVRQRLERYCRAWEKDPALVHVLLPAMHVPPPVGPCVVELDKDVPLRDALQGMEILEFPVLRVLLQHEVEDKVGRLSVD